MSANPAIGACLLCGMPAHLANVSLPGTETQPAVRAAVPICADCWPLVELRTSAALDAIRAVLAACPVVDDAREMDGAE